MASDDSWTYRVFIVRCEIIYRPTTRLSQDKTVEKFVTHTADLFPVSSTTPVYTPYGNVKQFVLSDMEQKSLYTSHDTNLDLEMFEVKLQLMLDYVCSLL